MEAETVQDNLKNSTASDRRSVDIFKFALISSDYILPKIHRTILVYIVSLDSKLAKFVLESEYTSSLDEVFVLGNALDLFSVHVVLVQKGELLDRAPMSRGEDEIDENHFKRKEDAVTRKRNSDQISVEDEKLEEDKFLTRCRTSNPLFGY
jgi:hypothetical protein